MAEESGQDRPKYISTSLEKALSILELFDGEEKLRVTKIANALEVQPGAIYPALYTLERFGYLERDEHKLYSLGLKFLEKSNAILKRMDIRNIARPYLKTLSQSFSANSHLAILYDWQVMYIEREESGAGVVIQSIIGRRVPAHCTALGKSFLAFLNENQWKAFLEDAELEPMTPNTITDRDTLKAELQEVRERGYAIDNEEFHEGIICIGAPVRDYQGEVVAAISISFPQSRFLDERSERLIKAVKRTATSISKALGYSGQ